MRPFDGFPFETLSEEERQLAHTLNEEIGKSPVFVFIKGTPSQPSCRFSASFCDILKEYGVAFPFIDVLAHGEVRTLLPRLSDWPTFPQLYLGGELIGGADIVKMMHESGELGSRLRAALEAPSL